MISQNTLTPNLAFLGVGCKQHNQQKLPLDSDAHSNKDRSDPANVSEAETDWHDVPIDLKYTMLYI